MANIAMNVDTDGVANIHNLSRTEYDAFPGGGENHYVSNGKQVWSKHINLFGAQRVPGSMVVLTFFTKEPPMPNVVPEDVDPAHEEYLSEQGAEEAEPHVEDKWERAEREKWEWADQRCDEMRGT